jgi:hypothetical protein
MNYGDLVKIAGTMPCFDLALLTQAFEDRRDAIRVQLSRWMTQSKVVGLRRGMYTLPETYRRVPLDPAELANALYRPSYLSGLWALGHYDLIPERVVQFTSVTPRVPRRFENPYGVFDYRNIKQDGFFGFQSVGVGARKFLIAQPEKALLDHWHLTAGEWTPERLEEMRYQHVEQIDADRLRRHSQRFRSPRLDRAVQRWLQMTSDAGQGTVAL